MDPGSWGTDGRDSSEGRSEGAAGQQQEGEHQGWQTRTSLSSSRQPAGVPGRRSPLREAPAGNRKGNGGSQNLRPHDVPYTGDADRTAGGQEDKRIMTLRWAFVSRFTKEQRLVCSLV